MVKFTQTVEEQSKNIFQLAESIVDIRNEALLFYAPLVDDVCCRKATENEIEQLLSFMLDFVEDERMLVLFKKVCRTYFYTYPEVVGFYVMECLRILDEDDE